MSNQASIKNKCNRCLGTGTDDNVTPNESCAGCGGTGYTDDGVMDTTAIMDQLDWLHRKVKKILDKFEIPE